MRNRKSNRLKGYDYGTPGMYFVTICVKNKNEIFGEVSENKVILNRYGMIVKEEIEKTKVIRPNTDISYWVIMPDHVHMIVTVGTHSNASLPNNHNNYTNAFGPQKGNLSSIVRGFKGVTTKRIRQIEPSFSWQPRFFDHIIRSDRSLEKIKTYIYENPANWTAHQEREQYGVWY